MPLKSSYGPLFSPAWVAALAPSAQAAQVATVRIYDPNVSQTVYDPIANTWVTATTEVYFGAARVQPLRGANQAPSTGNDTRVQSVLFALPIAATSALDFRTGLQAQVIDSPLNPSLLGYQYVLVEIMDSSNPVERTLIFTVNQETVVA